MLCLVYRKCLRNPSIRPKSHNRVNQVCTFTFYNSKTQFTINHNWMKALKWFLSPEVSLLKFSRHFSLLKRVINTGHLAVNFINLTTSTEDWKLESSLLCTFLLSSHFLFLRSIYSHHLLLIKHPQIFWDLRVFQQQRCRLWSSKLWLCKVLWLPGYDVPEEPITYNFRAEAALKTEEVSSSEISQTTLQFQIPQSIPPY
jgi:hypothetical protein